MTKTKTGDECSGIAMTRTNWPNAQTGHQLPYEVLFMCFGCILSYSTIKY